MKRRNDWTWPRLLLTRSVGARPAATVAAPVVGWRRAPAGALTPVPAAGGFAQVDAWGGRVGALRDAEVTAHLVSVYVHARGTLLSLRLETEFKITLKDTALKTKHLLTQIPHKNQENYKLSWSTEWKIF